MSDEKELRSDALLPSLDADPGLLPSLSEPAAQALTWRVVELWSNGRTGDVEPATDAPEPPLSAAATRELVRNTLERHARKQWFRAFAAAGFVLSLTGLAFGALRVWGPLASSTPAAESGGATATRQRVPKKRPPPRDPNDPPTTAPATATPSADISSAGAPVAAPAIVPSLERANALRAARAWQPAKRLYMRIAAEAEEPRERYVAGVAAAALCVQHTGEPQRGLGLYAAALAVWPEGDLSEEIRLGIAHAQRALERPRAEIAALRDFLAHHASSADAGAARERLAQLTETPSVSAPPEL